MKVDKSDYQELIPILFDLQEVLQEKYYIHTSSGDQRAEITVEKVLGNDNALLLYVKPEKAEEIMSKVLVGTAMSQCHLITDLASRKGLERNKFKKNSTRHIYNSYSNQKHFIDHLRFKGQY